MEPQGPDHRRSVHIGAIRVRAKGLSVSKARGLADGLGQAIAEALSAPGMTRAGLATVRIPGMDLGRLAVDGRPSAALWTEIASMVAASLARRPNAAIG